MKGRKNGGTQERPYHEKFNGRLQDALELIAVKGALPEIKVPQPNKAVRRFLVRLDTRLTKMGIKLRVRPTILGYIETGLYWVSEKVSDKAFFLVKIAKDLGIKMSAEEALEVVRGLGSMDEFLTGQLRREFRKHFHGVKFPESEDEDEDDSSEDSLEEEDLEEEEPEEEEEESKLVEALDENSA